ncbi:MAG: tRNA uridine-5-carboxymethylaminomethyl(34) synthesis enzyme MnmG [Candidatus Krumholzibacteriia bacterium]
MTNGGKLEFDIIVVGGGHAGCEAALAASRMGRETLLLTMSREHIARMPCNPAIGGLAKGQLAREVDALGGEMGLAIDETGIQFRMLNRAKGPAVWSPRAQADKKAYHRRMLKAIESADNIVLVEAEATAVLVRNGAVEGVEAAGEKRYYAPKVILALGTFPNGLMHIGEESFPGGREGEPPSCRLADQLISLGIDRGRLKTGTPARLARDSVDFSRCEEQAGDKEPSPFSFRTKQISGDQVPCHITYTNAKTHEIIRRNLGRSPLYAGRIRGIGPRYCPSIEDKVVRFSDRERHQLFLEPEGRESAEIYINGLSTSLPRDVQEEMIHSIAGLGDAAIVRYGYAIEYDYYPPHQLLPTLESRRIGGLYFAGQVNGTSGYEEAAAQGIMAGINAGRSLAGKSPLILGRHEAYIGVLVDDLVTKEIDEPYRMFTSRAEHRLVLRQDNADERLFRHGVRCNLLPRVLWEEMIAKRKRVAGARRFIERHALSADECSRILASKGQGSVSFPLKVSQLLQRPGISIKDIESSLPAGSLGLEPREKESLEIGIKYDGYIRRQKKLAERMLQIERVRIPPDFSYEIEALSAEARLKLEKFRPITLAQASRLSGVRSSDLSILMIHLGKRERGERGNAGRGRAV